MKQWNVVSAGPSRKFLRPEHLIKGAPVVTINRALDIIDQGFRVDFAAFQDGPNGCWTPCNLERYIYLQPHLQLWVSQRLLPKRMKLKRPPKIRKGVPSPDFLRIVSKVLPKQIGAFFADFCMKFLATKGEEFEVEVPGDPVMRLWDRVLPMCTGLRELPHGTVTDVNDPKQHRWAFTTICVLERIWMYRPDVVRIISADMSGPWIDGKTEEECHKYEKDRLKPGEKCPLDRWNHERKALELSIQAAQKQFPVKIEWVRPDPEPITHTLLVE